jgi:hypothetical protein
MKILNIAAGKFSPLPLKDENVNEPNYILNVDSGYFDESTCEEIEKDIFKWEKAIYVSTINKYLKCDVFGFMEKTVHIFDKASIYRFLEHVTFTQVEYFIYLVSTVVKSGGVVDVIVPNYKTLAKMILYEDDLKQKINFNYQAFNILLTTELLNEPSCPHASIWTVERMKYFWELEGRFKVVEQDPKFTFDGRSIYLRSIIKRI